MTQLDKLIDEFKRCAGPFQYKKLVRILEGLGYDEKPTSGGSRRRFLNPDTGHIITLHEPHPRNEIHLYLVKQVRDALISKGLI
ncbi:type II toxin-antitoxin system HicA family toxin [Phyllobacterium leguminum]|uniref:HicA-like toxin of HicAB toxin-antitoxin system n=1 Tax=Phyllobacterium leguminum TaxID=314237 RepID=A0A318T8T6_9HYPH|nr:type II toxin-antitoxin system HicA family toxin [Phyllobacterium leguminum]PYE89955.1 HicA-like toxin of HicAB toxin-antitoxin system [Phyllobacterium leguminum]